MNWTRVRLAIGLSWTLCATTPATPQGFGNWEVQSNKWDTGDELLAAPRLATSDLLGVEYLPKLSVSCDHGSVGPYGPNRTDYVALKVMVTWFAQRLPKEFDALDTFLRSGERNSLFVSYGRAWTKSGISQLIAIGSDDVSSVAIETVRIEFDHGPHRGYRFAAEVLDSGIAESFLKAWHPLGQIPAVLLDAQGHELSKVIDLHGMKPAVDRVLARCGRQPL